MSQGEARPFADVAPIAVELTRLLEPACERIAVAGSLRRRRRFVHDIELVAIPRIEEVTRPGFFEDLAQRDRVDRLTQLLDDLRRHGTLAARDVEVHRADGRVETQYRVGDAFQALVYRGIPCDLFMVRSPATWGVLYALRTGPYLWNIKLVDDCRRYGRRVEKGQVLHLGRPVPTPEETDFFRNLGQPWVEPRDRAADRVRIDPRRFSEVPT